MCHGIAQMIAENLPVVFVIGNHGNNERIDLLDAHKSDR